MSIFGEFGNVGALQSLDYHNMSIGEQALGVAFATVVDVGATMVNSLSFGYTDLDTGELLKDMGADGSLMAYENNRDLVNTLSFVGGVMIPGFAGVKLASAVRNGVRGFNALGNARRVEDMKKLTGLIEDGAKGHAEYKRIRNGMLVRGQAANLLDTVAAEGAMMAAFNAHPFMEDYLEDPIKNFSISLALGGGIGGALVGIADRVALRGAAAAVEGAAVSKVAVAANLFDTPFADTSSVLTHVNDAASRIEALAKADGINGYTRGLATDLAANMRARAGDLAKEKLNIDMPGLTQDQRMSIYNRFTDPNFMGVDSAAFFKPSEVGLKAPKKAKSFLDKPVFKKLDNKGEETLNRSLVFDPISGSFVDHETAQLLSGAADTLSEFSPKAIESVLSRQSKKYAHIETVNHANDLPWESTATVETEFLARLDFFSKQDTSTLLKTELYGNDLPAINGFMAARRERLVTLQSEVASLSDPIALAAKVDEIESLTNMKVKIRAKDRLQLAEAVEVQGIPKLGDGSSALEIMPENYFEDFSKLLDSDEITPFFVGSQNNAAAIATDFTDFVADQHFEKYGKSLTSDKDYQWNLNAVSADEMEAYSKLYAEEKADYLLRQTKRTKLNKDWSSEVVADSGLSPEAILLLARWISGSKYEKDQLRMAAGSARTLRRGQDSVTPFHATMQEILASPVALEQRKAMEKFADSQGNIYLKRGMDQNPVGDSPFNSYTPHHDTAEGFGEVKTFKVHLDDVLGFVHAGEFEVAVGTTTREALDLASQAERAGTPGANPRLAEFLPKEYSIDELVYKYADEVSAQLNAAKAETPNVPLEALAKRLNITPDAALMLGSGKSEASLGATLQATSTAFGKSPEELLAGFSQWSSASQIPEAFDPTRRLLQLGAKKEHHLGKTGEIMDKQRSAIQHQTELTPEYKNLINSLPESEATQRVADKLAVVNRIYEDVHKEWIDITMQTSNSELARVMMSKVASSSDSKMLAAGLSQFVNSKGGNPLFQSADMVTREMGSIGRLVTGMGEARANHTNNTIKKYLTPVGKAFQKFHTDPAARTEFAILDQFRLNTKGVLNFDSEVGRFYQESLDEMGAVVRTHLGPTAQNTHVLQAMDAMERAATELYQARSTLNRLNGRRAPDSIGFWAPSTKLINREYSYVVNVDDHTKRLLVADTVEELRELEKAYEVKANERIVPRTKADLEQRALMEDGLEVVTMADMTKQRSGQGPAIADIGAGRLEDIITGYTNTFNYLASEIVESVNFDTVQKLNYLSKINQQAVAETSKSGWLKAARQMQTKDTAADIKDIMLGRNPAYRSELVGKLNSSTDAVIQIAANAGQAAWAVIRPVGNGSVDYAKYEATLRAQGIDNPFKIISEAARPAMMQQAKKLGFGTDPNRVIMAMNQLASTTALKFFEIAQPLVNALSLPILTSSTISRAIKGHSIETGEDLLKASHTAIMYNGTRRAFSKHPNNTRLFALAKEEGLLAATVSEVDEVLKMGRMQAGGSISQIEKALDSRFVQIASKPSELADELVRKVSFGTGVEMAYRLYGGGVTDKQIMLFARDFMKQAVGNYATSQRPALFQGSLGAAAGLFQTYMVTYAQSMYGHLQLKDYAGLSKMMLAQGGIFGTGSLPGFQPISDAIGTHFSDEHIDLKTGMYRALPDWAANTLIYGMPANVLGAVHTRGDVSPRFPSSVGEMVGPSIVYQLTDSIVQVAKGAFQLDASAGTAMLEALSVQSASRPIARLAEVANGYAVTRNGVQVGGQEEVWSMQGLLARALSVRTLSEAKLREADHMNTFYGSMDRDTRSSLLKSIRQDLRSDNLTADRIDRYAHEYLRTGSPQGFRQALNQAFLENDNPGLRDLSQKLDGSPLMLMLDDLE